MGSIVGIYSPQKLRALTIGDIPQKSSDPWVGMRAMYELMTTNEGLDGEQIWKDYVALLAKYENERDTLGYPWQR